MTKIIVDTSTSMLELGKKDILEMVLKSIIDDFEDKNMEYKIIDFENNSIKFNNITFENKNLNIDLIDENSILLSDGLFEVKEIINKGNAISIGIDSNIKNLSKLAKVVYEVDEILDLLDLYHPNINNKEEEDEW